MTDPAAIVRSLESSTSRYEQRADGVVFQRLQVTRAQTLADARENTATFDRLVGDGNHPLIVDMRGASALERGVREYYASPAANVHTSAIALLIGSSAGRVIGNFFLALQGPKIPMKMFTEEADAVAWIRRVARIR